MGLDMYLNAKRFYWSHEETPEIKDVPDGYKVRYIEVEAAYWRKANAIHQWFVENVQDDVDDCETYSVSRDQLRQLVSVCKEVLEDVSKADELLPTADGFFFGDTSYEEYYVHCLNETIDQIEKALLTFPFDWHFEYHSSW
jgi:hypothetical protein